MQKMPNAHLAFISSTKLHGYLLNESHDEGGPKARFLRAIGFDIANPDDVESALLAHCTTNPAVALATRFGVKYHIDGGLISPSGRSAFVRTVWQIDVGTIAPRFVTLRPRVKT